MSDSTTLPIRTGPAPRGINASDVERAADALLRAGERPSIEKIRGKLGTGSPNTINPLLDAWWKKLSARLDAGPAALHRLPESVAHVAEALWMQALDEGRRRAAQEQRSTERTLSAGTQNLEVRSHVLSLREGELEARIRDREQRIATAEIQIQSLTTLLRKELANRDAQAQRVADLEQQLLRRPPPRSPKRRPLKVVTRAARVSKSPASSYKERRLRKDRKPPIRKSTARKTRR
jgi:hypothetical protein